MAHLFIKVIEQLSSDTAILVLGIYLRDLKINIYKKTGAWKFKIVVYNSTKLETTRNNPKFMQGEWIKKFWYNQTNN